jgi:hypothetical protein
MFVAKLQAIAVNLDDTPGVAFDQAGEVTL